MQKVLLFLCFFSTVSAIAANPGTATQQQIDALNARIDALSVGGTGLGTNYSSTCTESGGSCMIFQTMSQMDGSMNIVSINPFNITPSPSTGLSAANDICQKEGNARYGSGKTWKALLSDNTQNANTLVNASRSYINFLGSQIAVPGQLFTASSEAFQGVLASGLSIGRVYSWTGTTETGANQGNHCNDWTSALSTDLGSRGDSNSRDSTWILDTGSQRCDRPIGAALYCIEIG